MVYYKMKLVRGIKDFSLIIAGSFVAAAAINVFLVPYKIAPGGVTGIATVIYYLSGFRLSIGVTMLLINIPLFLIGIKFIGRRFIIRTLVSTLFLSFVIDVTEPAANFFVEHYLATVENAPSAPDLLLYSIFGGFLMGVGLGLVFKSGATTGGTDLAARIVNHFIPAFTIGQILLFLDACVTIFAAVTFKSFLLALYGIVALAVATRVIDAILEGVNFAKAVFIISDKSDEIADKILFQLDRGVTGLKGTGMYTGSDKHVLFCVVHRAQLLQLKSIVRDVDPKAFIVLADIREVLGEGFKTYE